MPNHYGAIVRRRPPGLNGPRRFSLTEGESKMSNAALRLVREDDSPAPASPADDLLPAAELTAAVLTEHLEDVQRQMESLKAELNVLRRRDETLNFYMHRIDEELRLAARLQQDFLPKELPQLGAVHFHTLFRPAGYVSGDLYDVMRLDERRIGFYMADAVGHGVPAALLTMFIKHALVTKQITADGYRILEPGVSLGRLNEALIEQNLSHATFATALYGVIDVDTLEVTMARAGHPSPIILRATGESETIQPDGSLLGIFPGERFENARTRLNPGDRMFIYTDGVEFAFKEEHPLQTRRWQDELIRRRHLPAAQLLSEFAQHLDGESGRLQPKDDITMIVVEIRP